MEYKLDTSDPFFAVRILRDEVQKLEAKLEQRSRSSEAWKAMATEWKARAIAVKGWLKDAAV